MKKVMQYKKFIIAVDKQGFYHIFKKEEWVYGEGYRYAEHEAGSIEEAKDFIDDWNN